jgi:23S rRNA (guanine745-N1)-methyltransferase
MVAARAEVQEAGHFEPLTAALADEAGTVAGPEGSAILDAGAGTGHHLAGVLNALAQSRGVALDASLAASRRAARVHERVAAVRSDLWQEIPLTDGAVDLALSVFAPRNGAELARVLRPGGMLMVVTPTSEHLHELATLHTIRVDPCKPERLRRQLASGFRPSRLRRISWTLKLTRREAEAVLRMGPAAGHLRADVANRLTALPEPLLVTGAVELRTFLRVTDAPAEDTRGAPRLSTTLVGSPPGARGDVGAGWRARSDS